MRRQTYIPTAADPAEIAGDAADVQPDVRQASVEGRARSSHYGALANTTDLPLVKVSRKEAARAVSSDVIEYDSGDAVTVIRVREQSARSFSSRTFTVSVPTLLAGDDAERVTLTVRNVDAAASVILGTYADVSGANGFTLPPGQALTTAVRQSIYAAPAVAGTPVSITLWMERDA